MYLNANKEDNYDIGSEIGLSGESLDKFKYALYEVECEVEVDMESGDTKLLSAKEV